eukprot:TRINITY_DN2931_c0_g1_i5.p1 TRINITY_DN2931_c0_g1~~TRINITY_DN2931_c0_g1_i5.p1  ORF type:complete len:2593 (+),score=522.82 TRINITY_DN2931_c0_g1_i5:630-7781(+)
MAVEKKIQIVVDYRSFVFHPSYIEKPKNHVSIIQTITNEHLPRLIKNGLVPMIQSDKTEVAKKAVSNRVKYIVFKYDPDNNVADPVGSYKYYKVELIDGALIFTLNLGNYSSNCHNVDSKFDCVFDLRTEQGAVKVNQKLSTIADLMENAIEKKVKVTVDYNYFVSHQEWKNIVDLSKKTKILDSIVDEHLNRLIKSGLCSYATSDKSEITKKTLNKLLSEVVFRYDPENNVNDAPQSYPFYRVDLNDGVMLIEVNLNKYDTSCHNFDTKFNIMMEKRGHLFTNLAVHRCNTELEKKQSVLESKVDKKIPILVDYRSFVKHKEWEEFDIAKRKKIIDYICDEHVTRTIINPMSELAKKEQWKEQFHRKVNHVLFSYDPENEIAEGQSYGHYEIKYKPTGQLLVRVNMNKYECSCHNADPRYEKEFKLTHAITISASKAKLSQYEDKLEAAVGTRIRIGVDWSFILSNEYADWLDRNLSSQQGLLNNLYDDHVNRVAIQGIASKCSDAKTKEFFKTNVTRVVFRYDPTDSVLGTGSYKHYTLTYATENTVVVTINMTKYSNPCYSPEDKIASLLTATPENISVVEGMPQDEQKRLDVSCPVIGDIPRQTPDDIHEPLAAPTQGGYVLTESQTEPENPVSSTTPTEAPVQTQPTQTPAQDNIPPHLPLPTGQYAAKVLELVGKDYKQFVSQERELKSYIKSYIRFTFDWQFLDDPSFSKLNNPNNAINQLVNSHAKTILSFFQRKSSDKIVQAAIAEHLHRIILSYDLTNQIKDKYGNENHSFWEMKYSSTSKDLNINISISKYDSSLMAIDDKFEAIPEFLLRVPIAKRDLSDDLKENIRTIKSAVGKEIPITIGWDDFVNHQNFLAFSPEKGELGKRTQIMTVLVKTQLQRIAQNIKTACESDKIIKEAWNARIDGIYLTYDPESKIKDTLGGESGHHWSIAFRSEDKVLVFSINMDKYDASLYFMAEKLDPIFDLRSAQAERDSLIVLKELSLQIKEHTKKLIEFEVDWKNFINHPKFRAMGDPDMKKLTQIMNLTYKTHLATIKSKVNDLCGSNANYQKIVQETVDKIRFTYEPESSISSKIGGDRGSYYTIDLTNKVLTYTLNLNKNDATVYGLEDKLKPIFESEILKRDLNENVLKAQDTISKSVNGNIEVHIDWDSFIKPAETFYLHNDAERASIQKYICTIGSNNHKFDSNDGVFISHNPGKCNTALSALVVTLNRIAENPIGANAVKDKVKIIRVADVPQNSSQWLFDKSAGVLTLHVKLISAFNKENIDTYHSRIEIENLLEVVYSVYEDYGKKKIAEYRNVFKNITGVDVDVEVDWSFSQNPKFLSNITPHKFALFAENIAFYFGRNIYDDLGSLCQHPVSKKCVEDHIKKVRLNYQIQESINHGSHAGSRPLSGNPNAYYPTTPGGTLYRRSEYKDHGISKSTGVLNISFSDIDHALSIDYKSLIEFDYGLIVPIAFHDTKKYFENTESELSSRIGYKFPIIVNTSFTDHPNFKSLPFNTQYDTIHILSQELLGTCIMDSQVGLMNVVSHPTGVPLESIKKEVDSISISLDPTNSIPDPAVRDHLNSNIGRVVKDKNLLSYTFNLRDALMTPTIQDFKERVLDAFNLVVKIAQCETEVEYQGYVNAITKGFKYTQSVINIDWSFDQSPQFKTYSPIERTQLIKNLCTTFHRVALIDDPPNGVSGVSQSRELKPVNSTSPQVAGILPRFSEFETVRSQFVNTVKKINLKVDSTSRSKNNSVSFANGELTLTFNLVDLLNVNVYGSGIDTEHLLKFRQIRQDAIIAEAVASISQACGSKVSQVVGKNIGVEFDSKTLISIQNYIKDDDYVRVTRNIVKTCAHIFTASGVQYNVENLIANNPHLKTAISTNVDKFIVRLDNNLKDIAVPKLEGRNIIVNVGYGTSFNGSCLSATIVDHFKERLLDLFDLIVVTGRMETDKVFNQHLSELRTNGRMPQVGLSVSWDDFIKAPEFLKLESQHRFFIVTTAQTHLVQTVLLGSDGFSGKFGLSEFPETATELIKNFSSILLKLDPKDKSTNNGVSCSNKVLSIQFNLTDVFKNNYTGCHLAVENLLKLRPIKEKCVMDEVQKHITATCSSIPCKLVGFDWEHLKVQPWYSKDSNYVAMTREMSDLPSHIFVGARQDYKNVGLSTLLNLNKELATAIKGLNVLVRYDATNKVVSQVGRSKTLYPKCFVCKKEGDNLYVYVNQSVYNDFSTLPKCGINVEWELTPKISEANEQAEINRIVASQIKAENERRTKAINDVNKNNQNAKIHYQEELKQWDRKCDDVRRNNEKPCRKCKGSTYYKCSCKNGYWGAKNDVRHGTCKGTGQLQCDCARRHPGKQNRPEPLPPRPSEPRAVPTPNFPPIIESEYRDKI